MKNERHWYCPHCTCEVEPIEAIFEERHESCGHPLEWIDGDYKTSILFSAPAAIFYKMTGRKPMKVVDNRVCFIDEYVRYLENRLFTKQDTVTIKKLKEDNKQLMLKIVNYQQKILKLMDE